MKPALLVLLFSLYLTQGMAQNLVKNSSLEILKNGVVNFSGVSGTPDIASVEGKVVQYPPYYNPYLSDVPGRSVANIEFGEVCFCLWFSSGSSELMQAELLKPLKKNREYVVSLYTIRTAETEPAIREVSTLFTKRPLPATRQVYGQEQHPLTGTAIPYISLISKAAPTITLLDSWTKVSALYKAQGGERYLTIGNFVGANKEILDALNPAASDTIKGYKTKGTYYCYDNISVVPLAEYTDEEPIPAPGTVSAIEPEQSPFAIGRTITLSDVTFATGDYHIRASAFPILNSLADYLQTETEAAVHVQGHTDDVGSEADNMALSIRRAEAVREYLVRQGILPDRITFRGFGESQPKVENNSDANRAQNRRVEIHINRR